jgi:hypothetical protein
MESVQFNSHPWQASVSETASGLFLTCSPAFSVPTGYVFELRRGLRSWTVRVESCTENPAGDPVTWLTVAVLDGPRTVVPTIIEGGEWRRKKRWG